MLQSGVDEGVCGVDCLDNGGAFNTVLLAFDGEADDVGFSSTGDDEGDVHDGVLVWGSKIT